MQAQHAAPAAFAAPVGIHGTVGAYKIDASLDADGHLTLIVMSTDGTAVLDTDQEVSVDDTELGFRFTTEKIEDDYRNT